MIYTVLTIALSFAEPEDFDKYVNGGKHALVEFYAPWWAFLCRNPNFQGLSSGQYTPVPGGGGDNVMCAWLTFSTPMSASTYCDSMNQVASQNVW